MALLEIRNITRRFGDFTAVDDVSLSIEAGEFFCLLGPSGCGKTTLLRMVAGFDIPNGGSIWLDGRDMTGVPPEKRNVHTVLSLSLIHISEPTRLLSISYAVFC